MRAVTGGYACIGGILLAVPAKEVLMAQLTVRNVDDEIVSALKVRAAQRGRSAEAEVREILRTALLPPRPGMAFLDFLASMPVDLDDLDLRRIDEPPRETDL